MEFSISELVNNLKRQWRIILISTLLFALIGAIFSFFFMNTKYEAGIKFFIGKEKFKNTGQVYNNDEVVLYQRLIKTYSEVVKTKDTVRNGIDKSGVDATLNNVMGNLSVTSLADTQIMQLNYKGSKIQDTYDLLYGISNSFITKSKELYPKGNVQVIEQINVKAIKPNHVINIAIGSIMGLILGIAGVLLLEYMDNTYKSQESLERELQLSVIGVIPDEE